MTVNLGGVARMPCWYVTSCELVFSSTMRRLFKKNLDKVLTWDITAADYPNMQYVHVTLEKIKDIQMQMEGSDQCNFIFICTKSVF